MVLDLAYLHSGLKNKGFRISKSKKHHYYCRYYANGEIFTSVSSRVGGHSKRTYKTLSDDLVSKIYRTLHFQSKGQFEEFLECPYTKEMYQKMLIRNGHLDLVTK